MLGVPKASMARSEFVNCMQTVSIKGIMVGGGRKGCFARRCLSLCCSASTSEESRAPHFPHLHTQFTPYRGGHVLSSSILLLLCCAAIKSIVSTSCPTRFHTSFSHFPHTPRRSPPTARATCWALPILLLLCFKCLHLTCPTSYTSISNFPHTPRRSRPTARVTCWALPCSWWRSPACAAFTPVGGKRGETDVHKGLASEG